MELLRVGVLEEDEVYRRGVMAVLNEDDCVCIVLGGDRETSPEAADAENSLDVVVVCSRALNERPFTCPVVVLASPELAGQEKGRAASAVMANVAPRGPDQPAAPGGRWRGCSRPAGRVAEPEF